MSTEHLTPEEQALENARALHLMGGTIRVRTIEAMKAYSSQQVEQQTKQLREERDMAIKLLGGFYRIRNGLYGAPAHSREIDHFFNQLNQQNEG